MIIKTMEYRKTTGANTPVFFMGTSEGYETKHIRKH